MPDRRRSAPSGGSESHEVGSVGAALPGMFATGEFDFGTSNALTVPQQAVVVRDGFSYIFQLGADQRVAQRKVQVGRRVGERIEVIGVAASATLASVLRYSTGRAKLWPSVSFKVTVPSRGQIFVTLSCKIL